jgi:hypothetical protein
VMVRNAVFRRVELAARDDLDGLMRVERAAADRFDPPREVVMTRSRWDQGLEDYFAEHDEIGTGPGARGPSLFQVSAERGLPAGVDDDAAPGRIWLVRQVIDDPAGDHDWVVEATVDLDASDELGEAVVAATGLRRL